MQVSNLQGILTQAAALSGNRDVAITMSADQQCLVYTYRYGCGQRGTGSEPWCSQLQIVSASETRDDREADKPGLQSSVAFSLGSDVGGGLKQAGLACMDKWGCAVVPDPTTGLVYTYQLLTVS